MSNMHQTKVVQEAIDEVNHVIDWYHATDGYLTRDKSEIEDFLGHVKILSEDAQFTVNCFTEKD